MDERHRAGKAIRGIEAQATVLLKATSSGPKRDKSPEAVKPLFWIAKLDKVAG
jgi:hypothetical protein